MASAFPRVDSTAVGVGGCDGTGDVARAFSVSLARLQHLEACEARADLQERHIQLMQKQIDDSHAALKLELTRGEKHAEALMHIAHSCDNRVDELKAQHAAAMLVKDDAVAALKAELAAVKASQAAAISKLSKLEVQHAAAVAALEAQVTLLQAQATSKLTDIHTAIAALQTLEIHPVRPDRRQFAEWRTGPVPELSSSLPQPVLLGVAFDRKWCTAACGTEWKVDLDAGTGTRAHVTQDGEGCLALRRTAPLPRFDALALVVDGWQHQQLPAPCRIVVEAYDRTGSCRLGFVPSHHVMQAGAAAAAAAVIPTVDHTIRKYGGWYIDVLASASCTLGPSTGWAILSPSCSAYATTTHVPAVPAGSAVEFAVDYAAGTCRVAFYTPAAVAGRFVAAPYEKIELRFVATPAVAFSGMPARPVPTLADSGIELYPAAETSYAGATWRFVS